MAIIIPPKATVKQLKSIAKDLGIKGYSTLRKDDLLKRIQKHTMRVPKPTRRPVEGRIMEIVFPGKDTTLFKIKEPGYKTYTDIYSYGSKSITFLRKELKEKYPSYKWIKKTTTIAYAEKQFPKPKKAVDALPYFLNYNI